MFKFQLICKEKNVFGEEFIRYINEDSSEAENLAIGLDGKIYELSISEGFSNCVNKEDVSDKYEIFQVYDPN